MTFVLIHGAWHGGWCWRQVLPLLRSGGHEVHAPTLTGLGERAHLAHPDINLDTHIRDVCGVIEFEELKDVVLVGHSYAGMVITGVADRVPDRIRRLIYFDAFVPENGKALIDYTGAERAARQRAEGEASGTVGPMPAAALGLTRPEDIAWATRRQVRHPYRTMSQPLLLSNQAALARIPKAFVNCHSATGTFEQFAVKIRQDSAWHYLELKTGHDAMIIDPQGTARILVECLSSGQASESA
ncbi:MAG: alpha/beta hydrolase [Betaproteobacteria bacterium]|nr:alpha/beta hydrolase [Betaproteobacteria bacterium]